MTKFFLPTIQRKKILEDAIKGRAPKELFYGMIDNNVDFEKRLCKYKRHICK